MREEKYKRDTAKMCTTCTERTLAVGATVQGNCTVTVQ